jgi:hypothetical protein
VQNDETQRLAIPPFAVDDETHQEACAPFASNDETHRLAIAPFTPSGAERPEALDAFVVNHQNKKPDGITGAAWYARCR